MARKKVKLEWISNDATRRATLRKRRKGLLKKLQELSILCDVRACAILYTPHEPHPEIWPSAAEATRVLSHLESMPDTEKSKKTMNRETYLRQRIAKLRDQIRRRDREIRDLEASALLRESFAGGAPLAHLAADELAGFACVVDCKAKEVRERINDLRLSTVSKGAVECYGVRPSVPPRISQMSDLVSPLSLHDYQMAMRLLAAGGEIADENDGSRDIAAGSCSLPTEGLLGIDRTTWENFEQ